MARSPYVWGIDIGKCSLKALRCRLSTDPRKLTVEAVEAIEYPMILSQPDADPVELVRTALEQFISRHNLKGDKVAVSAFGQSGLSKFIKLPPIEAKKIPHIVKYEARQQIPFPLEQVYWDWQRLAGGFEESGFVLEADVALFAMKREQVSKALEPLKKAGIEVDVLQLSSIALANMVMFDELPDPTTINPDNPPASVVLVATGVDSTDLVITNGLKIWQRSMPIGGGNFTKAIVKGMQLTFAKAEHLKRNAVRSEDPKAVFKVMRPVFNEFAAELQRSLNYFTGADRTAKIGKVLLLGNATKLRGLADFVGKQLQLDVQRLESFRGLEGSAALSTSAFRDNHLAFGTAYGLALQAAGKATMRTNLLPPEIVLERLIEAKKPWALGAMVGLLLAAVVSFAATFFAWTTFAPQLYAEAFTKSDGVKARSQKVISAVDDVRKKQSEALLQQHSLLRVRERRFQTIDMLRAIETLLPRNQPGKQLEDPSGREALYIDRMDCQYFPELSRWFAGVEQSWVENFAAEGNSADPSAEVGANSNAAAGRPESEDGVPGGPIKKIGPQGPGWVIELTGHHFHNEDEHKPNETAQFVRSTLVQKLLGEGDKVFVAAGPKAGEKVTVTDLGIGWPVIVYSSQIEMMSVRRLRPVLPASNPAAGPPGDQAAEPAKQAAAPEAPQDIKLKRYNFVLQFCWQPTVPGAVKLPQPSPPEADE